MSVKGGAELSINPYKNKQNERLTNWPCLHHLWNLWILVVVATDHSFLVTTWAYHLSTKTWPSIIASMLTAPPWSLLLGGAGSYRSVEKHTAKSTWWKISKPSLSNITEIDLLRLARPVTLPYNSVRMKENTANNINMTTNPEHLETLDDISIQTLIDHYLSVAQKLPDNVTVRDRLVELQQELLNRTNKEWWQC